MIKINSLTVFTRGGYVIIKTEGTDEQSMILPSKEFFDFIRVIAALNHPEETR